MWAAAPLLAVTLAATPAAERVLVCRARVGGDPALARADAVVEAVRELGDRALDYGVACETTGEAARAARRAGLRHAVTATVEGRTEGSLFELSVLDAEERVIAIRRLAVPPGGDAVRPVAAGLAALVDDLPRPEAERTRRRASVGLAAGGLAMLAGGAALALVARADADRANAATTPLEYLGARSEWRRSRGWSGAALGLGGAALMAGIVWRLQLPGEAR